MSDPDVIHDTININVRNREMEIHLKVIIIKKGVRCTVQRGGFIINIDIQYSLFLLNYAFYSSMFVQ